MQLGGGGGRGGGSQHCKHAAGGACMLTCRSTRFTTKRVGWRALTQTWNNMEEGLLFQTGVKTRENKKVQDVSSSEGLQIPVSILVILGPHRSSSPVIGTFGTPRLLRVQAADASLQ